MSYFILGIEVGFIYALVSLGIVLIYRTTRVLNFAHGDFATLGTFIALSLIGDKIITPSQFILYGLIGSLISSVLAFLIYFFILYEGQRRGVSPLGLTIITIAISFLIQTVEIAIWGPDPKALNSPFTGETQILDFKMRKSFILTSSTSLILMAILYFVVMRTKVGIFMRAISQNLDMARVLGIKTRWIIGFTWAISTFTAGIAGFLIAPLYFVDQFFMFDPFLRAFIGAVIGGLDSPPGAIVGSLIVGITETLFGGYVSIKYKTAFVFLVGLIFLALRPEGIFGKEIKERV
ncbi:MAG: branched-chain amino acid ABC transporter permease [Candidatus Calescibacterium sp.]|jgi:branched-chain amino acid transport system permease protein|nr:branched-chain amino acid ABC transporter permease [Candidatus Calescibacterium sp.]